MSTKRRAGRSPWRWLLLSLVASAAVLGASMFLPWEHARQVGSGFLALLLFVGSTLYGARKWLYVTRWGGLHDWMVGHVALGGALLVTVLGHADLSDLGSLGWALVGLVALKLVSGVWSLTEQSKAPRRFAGVSTEELTHPTTVRRRVALLVEGVEEILGRRSPELRRWFDERYGAVLAGQSTVAPALEGFPAADARPAEELHERASELARLRQALARLEPAERAAVRWTWIHVPVTVALVTLVVLHVIGWIVYG